MRDKFDDIFPKDAYFLKQLENQEFITTGGHTLEIRDPNNASPEEIAECLGIAADRCRLLAGIISLLNPNPSYQHPKFIRIKNIKFSCSDNCLKIRLSCEWKCELSEDDRIILSAGEKFSTIGLHYPQIDNPQEQSQNEQLVRSCRFLSQTSYILASSIVSASNPTLCAEPVRIKRITFSRNRNRLITGVIIEWMTKQS